MVCMFLQFIIWLYRPVVKDIEIENLSQDIIFIEPKFSSRRKGIELLIEESNPDSVLKDCKY